VCYGRLGRYDDQLTCASEAAKDNQALSVYFAQAQLASSLALSLAALGRLEAMRATIEEWDQRLSTGADPYISQAWCLWKADSLATAGLFDEAFRVGAKAVLGFELRLLCSVVAGAFARWLAITCRAAPHRDRAASILADMEANLDSFDALDQIEILCATLQHGSNDVDRLLQELHMRTRHVPETALASLRVCGIPVGF
jgi:hypothetical protein